MTKRYHPGRKDSYYCVLDRLREEAAYRRYREKRRSMLARNYERTYILTGVSIPDGTDGLNLIHATLSKSVHQRRLRRTHKYGSIYHQATDCNLNVQFKANVTAAAAQWKLNKTKARIE